MASTRRDCQGFQKPQGSGVRVQEGRVGVGILYPHETLTLARGQGVCQGYVQGGNSSILQYFCSKKPSFPSTKNIFSIYKSILHGSRVLEIHLDYLTYEKEILKVISH